jgi:hypothetical protein
MTVPWIIRFAGLASSAALVALAPAGCMESKVESKWLDRAITIDGKAPEWAGQEAYYDEDQGLKIGFFNDPRYLYIYISTWHQDTQRQILMNGFTVWFDAKGGKKETFAVNYPVRKPLPAMSGANEPAGRASRATEGASQAPRGHPGERTSESTDNNQDMLTKMLSEASGTLQILGTDEQTIASLAAIDSSSSDIQAMIDIVNRTLIYELKIPLAGAETPYAINSQPGNTIGVGLKVGKREMGDMKRKEGVSPDDRGGGPGGGSPGGGGGGFPGGGGGFPGDGMGGPGGAPGQENAESTLELWLKVRLAADTSAK